MSFVTVDPESLTAAAAGLRGVGHTVNAGMALAAAPTTGVVPPAADPVSGLTTALFGAYAHAYQAVAAQAAAGHEQFVSTMATSAGSYATTESANAASTSSATEIEEVIETWINGAITSPTQVYLSAIVPYLLGIVTSATALTFEPVAAAPGAGLVSEENTVPGPDQRASPNADVLVSAGSPSANGDSGKAAVLGRTISMEAFSPPPNTAMMAPAINPVPAFPDATPLVPAAAPGSLYSEPSPAAPAGHTSDGIDSRVGARGVIARSPVGG